MFMFNKIMFKDYIENGEREGGGRERERGRGREREREKERERESLLSHPRLHAAHHVPAMTRRTDDAEDGGLVFFVGVRAMPQAALGLEPASTSTENAPQLRGDPLGGFGEGGAGNSAMVAASASASASASANVNGGQALAVGPEVYLEYVGYVAMESSGFITLQVRASWGVRVQCHTVPLHGCTTDTTTAAHHTHILLIITPHTFASINHLDNALG